MVHDDYFFDKDCPSYAQGGGTTEFWKDMSDKYKKQNDLFRDKINKLEAANRVLMGAVEMAIRQSKNSCQLDGCTCVRDGLKMSLTEVKRIMEDEYDICR